METTSTEGAATAFYSSSGIRPAHQQPSAPPPAKPSPPFPQSGWPLRPPAPAPPNSSNRAKGKGRGRGSRGKGGGTQGFSGTPASAAPTRPGWPSFYNPWTGTINMWPGPRPPQARPPQHALLAASGPFGPISGQPPLPQPAPLPTPQYTQQAPLPTPQYTQQAPVSPWTPWTPAWDQQSLANFFGTLSLTPPTTTDWAADTGTSDHTSSCANLYSNLQTLYYNKREMENSP